MDESVLINAIRPVDAQVADATAAIGVFGLQDNYLAIVAGGIAAGEVADAIAPDGGAVVAGVAGAAGMHAAREVNAAQKGVTVQIVVAVTGDQIALFDYRGGTVTRVIHTFDRKTMHVEVTRFGLSRRVQLRDETFEIGLTGSTAFYSAVAAGDKHVLAEMLSAGS